MNAVDYLILGTSVGGLTFADIVLSESTATIAFVEENTSDVPLTLLAAGGRESGMTGMNRYTVSDWCEEVQPVAFKHPASSLLPAYRRFVLEQRLLPDSRVQLLRQMEHLGEGRLRSQPDGQIHKLDVRRKIVNAKHISAPTCAAFIPCFTVAPGVTLINPQSLTAPRLLRTSLSDAICILGGGRSGTEMVLALLNLGISSDRIFWVKSRDPWMLSAPAAPVTSHQSNNPLRVQHESLKAMAHAHSTHDLCLRLERLGVLVRTSTHQTPTYFSPHFVTPRNALRLQQLPNTIRKGHVHAITEIGMILSRGIVPMPPQTLYIDCTGSRTQWHQTERIFTSDYIELADIRLCHPSFSAAMIGAIELLDVSVDEKNALCGPVNGAGLADLLLASLLNHHAWLYHDDVRHWLESCRLDRTLQKTAQKLNSSPKVPRDLRDIRATLPRAIINLQSLIEQERSADPLRA